MSSDPSPTASATSKTRNLRTRRHQKQQRTLQQQQKNHRKLIVGGHDISPHRYPYFVSIKKYNGIVLNGALIAPDMVLTAGHVALSDMDDLTLTIHAYSVSHDIHGVDHNGKNVSDDSNNTWTSQVAVQPKEWMVHPDWDQFQPLYFAHDILVLNLATPVPFHVATPVRLNRNAQIPSKTAAQEVTMMGLGWTNATIVSPSDRVQETTLLVLDNDACAAAQDPARNLTYADKIVPSMLCTVSPPDTEQDGCAWDSGAPVILRGDSPGDDLLVGLASTGVGCADPFFPGIQARVSADIEWITAQVCAFSTQPPDDFECGSILEDGFLETVPVDVSGIATDLWNPNQIKNDMHKNNNDYRVSQSGDADGIFFYMMLLCYVIVMSDYRAGWRLPERRAGYTPVE